MEKVTNNLKERTDKTKEIISLSDEKCKKKCKEIESECNKKIEQIKSVLMKNSYHKIYDEREKKQYPRGIESRSQRLGIQDKIY